MEIKQNVSLENYSTMGLGGNASYLTEVTDRNSLIQALQWAEKNNQPVIMIGGGSNIVWGDSGFKGLVIVNDVHRYEIFEEDQENTYITIGAGENWDKVVENTVNSGLSGIEALSLIPGTSGATLVQNIGAYGQDISQTLVTAEVYDKKEKKFMILTNSDCAFGYRTSRFKTTDKGRFFIMAITLHLKKSHMQPPFYDALSRYLREKNIKDFSPKSIRQAVIAIRSSKLPDPAKVKNCGSFFANPVIPINKYLELKKNFNDMPHWLVNRQTVKVPAAWLIEKSGFKDYHDEETGMATWINQPLVLVNESAKTTDNLLKFMSKIENAVFEKFAIKLEQEPELISVE